MENTNFLGAKFSKICIMKHNAMASLPMEMYIVNFLDFITLENQETRENKSFAHRPDLHCHICPLIQDEIN